jgi:hypothetical protein
VKKTGKDPERNERCRSHKKGDEENEKYFENVYEQERRKDGK